VLASSRSTKTDAGTEESQWRTKQGVRDPVRDLKTRSGRENRRRHMSREGAQIDEDEASARRTRAPGGALLPRSKKPSRDNQIWQWQKLKNEQNQRS
jgi:hypothetical protein